MVKKPLQSKALRSIVVKSPKKNDTPESVSFGATSALQIENTRRSNSW